MFAVNIHHHTDSLFVVDIDDCNQDPCLNGATCNDEVNSYSCTCVAGYAGTDCESKLSTARWGRFKLNFSPSLMLKQQN